MARAVLEQKYSELCPPEYVQMVADSNKEDPVQIRDLPCLKDDADHKPTPPHELEPIAMTINDKHDIHHIKERGHLEAPVRINAILEELDGSGLVEKVPVREYPMDHILEVHNSSLVNYLETACANAPEGKSVYPCGFPIRNAARPPKEWSVVAGYCCIDTFTAIKISLIRTSPVFRTNGTRAAARGFNLNIALPEELNGEEYRVDLATATETVKEYDPAFLVIALGLDPAKGDPTGTRSLGPKILRPTARCRAGYNCRLSWSRKGLSSPYP